LTSATTFTADVWKYPVPQGRTAFARTTLGIQPQPWDMGWHGHQPIQHRLFQEDYFTAYQLHSEN